MSRRNTDDLMDEIKAIMSGENFTTLEEANVRIAEITHRRNHAPAAGFSGLSPAMMHRFLSFPLESPDLLEFSTKISLTPITARVARLFLALTSAIGEKGVKATTTGNLPLVVVRSVIDGALSPEELADLTRFRTIRSENDFIDLHVTRVLGEQSGMLRKVKERYTLTKACEQLLDRSGMAEIYPRLFRAYATKLNWSYLNQSPPTSFIQNSFAFSLYLISRFGDEWRPPSFYEDAFLEAFPAVLDGLPDGPYQSAEAGVRDDYTYCVFNCLANLFGLVDTESEQLGLRRHFTALRRASLLNELVTFHIPGD